MAATPQDGAPTPKPDTAPPRFGRRTLLTGAGGVAGAGLLGGTWYVWHGRQPLHTLGGHTRGVSRVALSPDGVILADASYDGTVRLWQVSDGHLLRTLEAKDAIFQGVAFSPDGERVMAGSGFEPEIYQWRVGDSALIGEITVAKDTSSPSVDRSNFSAARDVVYAPDGALIACGTLAGYVYLWRASDGQFVRKMRSPKVNDFADVARVAFSPDGQTFAAALGRHVEVRRLNKKAVHSITVGGESVRSIVFSPDGRLLATASGTAAQIWRLR